MGTTPFENLQLPKLLKGHRLTKANIDDPIDIVITWVDMSDPSWMEKYTEHTGKKAAPSWRYRDYGELELCIASVMKYMPWIRTFYLITDNQTPDFISKYPKVKVIDHSEILGEECAKPTFNSNVIEAYMHRIPGLSEVFLWGNDDCMVGRPSNKSDWFQEGVPSVTLTTRCLTYPIKGFDRYIWNSINLAGNFSGAYAGYYEGVLANTHQINLLRKSSCERNWSLFPEEMKQLVSGRTRDNEAIQIQVHLLAAIVGIHVGDLALNFNTSRPGNFLGGDTGGDKEKLERFYARILKDTPAFYCLNSVKPAFINDFEEFKKTMLARITND